MGNRSGSDTRKFVGLLVLVSALVIGGLSFLASQMRPGSPHEGGPATTARRVPVTPTIPPGTSIPSQTPAGSEFEWSDVETGELLVWGERLAVAGQTPLALVEHDDSLFLFTTSETREPISGQPVGGQVWSSEDGLAWFWLHDFDTDSTVVSAFSTPFGLVAYGLDVTSGDGVVWRSDDGRTWDHTVVAVAVPGKARFFEAGAATDEVIVIAGGLDPDAGMVRNLILQALHEHFGTWIQGFAWGDGVNPDSPRVDSRIVVFAPLGLPIMRTTPSELGLDLEDLQHPEGDRQVTVWVSNDGSNWSEVTPGDDWYATNGTSLAVTGGIRTLADRTVDEFGYREYVTTDGITWEESNDTAARTFSIRPWEGGIMATSLYGDDLRFSNDGLQWRNLNLWAIFDSVVRSWSYDAIDAGAAGIGVVVRGARPFDSSMNVTQQLLGEWSDGNTQILVYIDRVEVHQENGQVLTLHRGPWDEPGGVQYDPATRSLTFIDPDSGDELAHLTFDEWQRLESSIPSSFSFSGQGLLFSSAADWPTPGVFDALRLPTAWIVQELAGVTDGDVTHVHVGSDKVLLVVSNGGETRILAADVPTAP